MSRSRMTGWMSGCGWCGTLCWGAWLCVIAGFVQRGFAALERGDGGTSLATIRQLAEQNEFLTSLIKLDYSVRTSSSDPEAWQRKMDSLASGPSKRIRRAVPKTQERGIWAQDGVRQYVSEDTWYADGKKEPGAILVIDGEVWKSAMKPDLMIGSIEKIENFGWAEVTPLMFGPRLLTGAYSLRQVLQFESASVEGQEVIDSRGTWVVDVVVPGHPYHIRLSIDQEAGVPLRVAYYKGHPSSANSKLEGEIKDIRLHRLPNGGWIPIRATRAVHRRYETRFEHLEVDVNSITINREDIPDSLFNLEFPENAKVYNAILGIATQGGEVRDRQLDRIIDQSLETLEKPAAPQATSAPEEISTPKDSQQAVDESPPNEPARLTEPAADTLLTTSPTDNQHFWLVWIFLSAVIAALALRVMLLIFRRPSKNTTGRNNK